MITFLLIMKAAFGNRLMSVPPGHHRRDKSILVVEDEDLIRDLIVDVLEMEGYEVVALANADLALHRLKHSQSDVALLLTDVNMPGSINDGELANLCGNAWPWIPIIVMSGYETLTSAGIATTAQFIRKPFQIDEILSLLQVTLSHGVR